MRVLKESDYNALKAKADSFDSIVNAIVAAGENITAADVTAETVIETLQNEPDESEDSNGESALQTRVTELETQLQERDETITALNTQIADFNGAPAGEPATITPTSEPGSTSEDIAAFADKNKGDTQAILARAKEEGLI